MRHDRTVAAVYAPWLALRGASAGGFVLSHTWSNHVGPRALLRGVSLVAPHTPSPVLPGVSRPFWKRLVFVDTMANRDHSESRSPMNAIRRDACRLSQASTVARGDFHSEWPL